MCVVCMQASDWREVYDGSLYVIMIYSFSKLELLYYSIVRYKIVLCVQIT